MPIITIQRATNFFLDEENILKDIIFPERTPIPYLPEVLDEVEDVVFDDANDMIVNVQQRIGEPRRFIIREDGEVVEVVEVQIQNVIDHHELHWDWDEREEGEIVEESEEEKYFIHEMTEKEADDLFEALNVAVEKSGHDDLCQILDMIGVQNHLPCLNCLRVERHEMLRCQECKGQPNHFLSEYLNSTWTWNVNCVSYPYTGEYEYEDKTFEDDYFSDDDGYDSDGYGMTPSFL